MGFLTLVALTVVLLLAVTWFIGKFFKDYPRCTGNCMQGRKSCDCR